MPPNTSSPCLRALLGYPSSPRRSLPPNTAPRPPPLPLPYPHTPILRHLFLPLTPKDPAALGARGHLRGVGRASQPVYGRVWKPGLPPLVVLLAVLIGIRRPPVISSRVVAIMITSKTSTPETQHNPLQNRRALAGTIQHRDRFREGRRPRPAPEQARCRARPTMDRGAAVPPSLYPESRKKVHHTGNRLQSWRAHFRQVQQAKPRFGGASC